MTAHTMLSNQVGKERFEKLLIELKDTNFRYSYGETEDGAYTGQTHLFYATQKDLTKFAKDNSFTMCMLGDSPHLTVGKEIQFKFDKDQEIAAWVNEVIGVYVEYIEVSDV